MQAPLKAESIFSRTLQSVFLTSWGAVKARAFPREEFKERKGSTRSLRSGAKVSPGPSS